MADTRYLEKIANEKWRVVVSVPRDLRATMGRTVLKRSLGTDSLTEANRLKWAVVAELKNEIEEVRNPRPKELDNVVLEAAVEMRAKLAALPAGSEEAEEIREHIDLVADALLGGKVYADSEGNTAPAPALERLANEFGGIATGARTPLADALPKFHSQGKWNDRTKADSERAVGYLVDWCKRQPIPATVEAITRKRAGVFIGDMSEGIERPDKRRNDGRAKAEKLSNRTVNKYLSCLSRYWEWLENRGYLPEGSNVWQKQSLPKEVRREGEKEREFTDKEMKALLRGEPIQPYMKPLMLIGALTGARIGAIAALKVSSIEDGCFRFAPQKRETHSRLVPIHSALVPVVAALCEGKSAADDLFPALPPLPAGDIRERSMPAVKAFGRYREKVGVSETLVGRRRDLVNFHSFRRWFITKAFQAGQSEPIIQAVVGQKPNTVARQVYFGGFTVEQLRECVEAVKLPSLEDEAHSPNAPSSINR